jgi:hypothetical protein
VKTGQRTAPRSKIIPNPSAGISARLILRE